MRTSIKLYHVGGPIEDFHPTGHEREGIWTFANPEHAMNYSRSGAVWEIEVPVTNPAVQQAMALVRDTWGYTVMGRRVPGVRDPFERDDSLNWMSVDRVVLKKEDCTNVRLYSDRGHPEWAMTEEEKAAKRASTASGAASDAGGDVGSAASAVEKFSSGGTASGVSAANGGGTDWYGEYRELNNRRDMVQEGGGKLPPDQEARWSELNDKLMEEAYGPGGGGGGGFPPAPPTAPEPARDPKSSEVVQSAESLKNQTTESAPEPPRIPLVENQRPENRPETYGFAEEQHPHGERLPLADSSLPQGYGVHPPDIEPPTDARVNEGEHSTTPAFDRPQPVIVMGPKPLPVTIANLDKVLKGLGAASGNSPEEREQKSRKHPLVEAGEHIWSVMEQASPGGNQSGANLFRFMGRMGRIGRGLGGRLKGLYKYARGGRRTAGAGRGAAAAGRAASAAGGAARGAAVAAGAGSLAGALGAAGAAVGVVTVAMIEAGKATYEFARAQEREVRKLAEVGPQQAAAVAQLDAERTMRQVKTASETGDTSRQQIESLSRLENAMQPFESAMTNLSNVISSAASDVFADILEALEPLADLLQRLAELLGGDKKKEMPEVPFDMIAKAAAETARINRPQWPQGGTDRPFWPGADHGFGQQ